MARIEWSAFRSRLAQRLAISLVGCAVVPFLVAAAVGFSELRKLTDERSAERLQQFASAYGMSVIGRLKSAASLLAVLADATAHSNDAISRPAVHLGMFTDVRVIVGVPEPPHSSDARRLPWPSTAQRQALTRNRTVILLDREEVAGPRVFLVRRVPGTDTWLYGEVAGDYLWESSDARSGIAGAIVVDGDGALVHASDPQLSPSLFDHVESALQGGATENETSSRAGMYTADGQTWQAYRWEVFLEGTLATPSWQVIAVARRIPMLAQLGRLQLLFPALLAATLLATLWFAVWRIRRYFEPLEQLIAGTRRLSRRDFDAVVSVTSDDEVGELALSFNLMAASLKQQFETLETMGEVDRLLLRSPGLEQILDVLLPRIAALLDGRTASVLLIDADAPGHARIYDFAGAHQGALPVRRVTVDSGQLNGMLSEARDSHATLRADGSEGLGFIAPLEALGASIVSVWPLYRSHHLAGLLCLGFDDDRALADPGRAARGREFADRLAVVLANVEHKQALYRQAHYDSLTSLPNRALFSDRLSTDIAGVASGGAGALLYIDLDHFKRVNDTAGHGSGDELLKIAGQRIVECVKEGDTVARLGGDEFAVILRHLTDPVIARGVADRILASLTQPVSIAGRDHYVTASIGVTLFPGDGRSIETLLKNSDIAMYRAKEAGRCRAVFFEPEMNARMLARATLETGLHRALRQSQFELFYQPIIHAGNATLGGVEALLRWPSGPPDYASPATFIPAAEESGLIVELGNWVLDTACRQIAAWIRAGHDVGYVSVNVSSRQLREADFPDQVRNALERHGLSPQRLRLEITESVLADSELAAVALARLAKLRVGIALDDFGTGYSSLSYLRKYPIDMVKIDRSFIQDVPASEAACALVETIIAMGHSLRKTVVAEGVETTEQLTFLRSRNCDGVQGFLLAVPMKGEQLERRIHLCSTQDLRWAC
jgi:diguanylate cyclase (GGDEF)-like protein